jgi:hypothetical protein
MAFMGWEFVRASQNEVLARVVRRCRWWGRLDDLIALRRSPAARR